MNIGDFVSGVPSNPDTREKFPRVYGTYSKTQFEFAGETYEVEFVKVQDTFVDCDDIKPASQRRNQETDIHAS